MDEDKVIRKIETHMGINHVVIKSPKQIAKEGVCKNCGSHDMKAHGVWLKCIYCQCGQLKDGNKGIVARFPREGIVPQKSLISEIYEPKDIEQIDPHKLFDFKSGELTDPLDKEYRERDRPRLVSFKCGDCGIHKTFNTKYDKSFKNKEECSRCGQLIKAEIVG